MNKMKNLPTNYFITPESIAMDLKMLIKEATSSFFVFFDSNAA